MSMFIHKKLDIAFSLFIQLRGGNLPRGGKKERLSKYDVGVAILSYLVRNREDNKPKVTTRELSRKPPEFVSSTQRQQRIKEMLESFEQQGFVNSETYSMGTVWEITDKGYDWYKTIAKDFMSIF
jgi:CTP-dependent riboflavin kinase